MSATAFTRGGTPWTPQYVEAINPRNCIGCGACGRTCPKGCFAFIAA